MSTAAFAPLSHLRKLRWLRRVALPVFVAVFLAAGLAHAGHLHKPDATRGVASEHCGLCLQFDRLAGAPVIIAEALAVAACQRIRSVAPALPACVRSVSAYLARGPPTA